MESALDSLVLLGPWVGSALLAQAILLYDLSTNNTELGTLMKAVWILTVAYSGLLGLAVYGYAGRKQITQDSIWRRGFRSVAHCYSGCGAGEIAGVLLAVGLFSLGTAQTAFLTLSLAFLFGYVLTVGPLLQDGVSLTEALTDALYTETVSIASMEAVAISVDIALAGDAGIMTVQFWTALVISLSAGLLAAYPVNILLIRRGVKEGMMSPTMQ